MTTIAVRTLSILLRIFPFSQLRFASGFISFFIGSYRAKTIEENLSNTYPKKSRLEIKHLRREYIKQLSNVIAESLKGYTMNQDDLAKRFRFNNPKIANQYFDQGKSIILCLGHIGNWEWGQAVVSHYLKFNCVGVYKSLSNKSFDKYLLKKRSQFGVKLLSQKEILKYIISHPDEVNVYIFIADQYPPTEPRMSVDFLNQETYFDKSIEKIALKYELPVVYADIKRTSAHEYETDLIEISSDPSAAKEGEITRCYANLLNQNIKRQPQLWLWSHRRWKK